MSGEGVFLVGPGAMVEMRASRYDAETDLQMLLEEYPALLAGRLIDPVDPRHWLLIAREKGVPSSVGGTDRWSADHLFVDQDGIPTIVEVKRSTDTRIRREVVGQMLDYAANGVRYWPPEQLRADLAERVGGQREADARVRELLEEAGRDQSDVEEFWERVADNLRTGRLRMLFVADEIPAMLQRIIEFLNEQMTRCEVLGVEIRQYVAEDQKVLAPSVIGRTSQSQVTKKQSVAVSFEELLEAAPPDVAEVEELLSQQAAKRGWHITTSKVARQYRTSDGATMCQLYADYYSVEFYIGELDDDGQADEARALLDELGGLAAHTITKRHPSVRTASLLERWEQFQHHWLPRYLAAHERRNTR